MKFSDRVPREYGANLRWRLFVLKKAKGNLELQSALRYACRQDILFYINTFVYQTNPNKEDESAGPFITWKSQELAITSEDEESPGILWCIANGRSLVIEKSRDMGATWLLLIVKDWKCRSQPYYDSLMMSKSAKAVDSSSRQSLFGKLRFIQEHLPKWLHDRDKFIDNVNTFVYPGTKSTMTGFSSTGKAGVSERGGDFFVDEYPQIEEDWEVLYRTQATSKCRIFVGTHMGMGTAFYALTRDDHFKKIVFHWTQHPDKNKGMYRYNLLTKNIEHLQYNVDADDVEVCENQYEYPPGFEYDMTGLPTGGPHPGVRSPWYDHAFAEMGCNVSEMAKDHDINPSGSIAQFYSALVIRDLIETLAKPAREYELEYDKETGVPARFIPQPGGRIKLWCVLDHKGRPAIDFYGAGCDISQGEGATPSCISIIAASTGVKVLEFVDASMDPKIFAVFCVALCRMFCDSEGQGAKIAWENHGPGISFGNMIVQTLKYMRVYYNTRDNGLYFEVSEKPGFYPNGPSRLGAHLDYRQALSDRKCINYSKSALAETLNFKHDGKGSVEHTKYASKDPKNGRENHGDVVVGDFLAWRVVKDAARYAISEEAQQAKPGTFEYLLMQDEAKRSRGTELHPMRAWLRRV